MAGNQSNKEEFGEAGANLILDTSGVLSGAGGAGTVALTANTWAQIPSSGSVPADPYVLVIAKENEVGVIRYSFANSSTPSATYGNTMGDTPMAVALAGGEVMYVASTETGDDVNFTTKII